jgi:uroporphyrinogen-III synthase
VSSSPGSDRPLRGRTILLTRPPDRAGELGSRLEALGAAVAWRPAIAFELPRDAAAARRAAARLSDYDWAVFTSVNGVRFFQELRGEPGCGGLARRVRVVAVGPATARALAALGLEPQLVAPEAHAEGLARALRCRALPGDRLLLVRPEVANEEWIAALRASGVLVEAVAFYRTVSSPGVRELARDLADGRFDAVVLTSPSNLACLLEGAGRDEPRLRAALARVRRVAIGPTTTRALEEAGLPAHAVAASPDDEGIVAALLRCFV